MLLTPNVKKVARTVHKSEQERLRIAGPPDSKHEVTNKSLRNPTGNTKR